MVGLMDILINTFGIDARCTRLLEFSSVEELKEENVMPVFKGKAKFLVSGLNGAGAAVLGAAAVK